MESRARLLIVFSDDARRTGFDEAYAHPEVWGCRLAHNSTYPYTYKDLDTYGDYDRKAPLTGFRITSQVDSRDDVDAWPYAVKLGFKTEDSDMMQLRDVEYYGKTLATIDRGLTRMHDVDGPVATFGAYVLRVARLLKVDAIVIMKPRPWYNDTDVASVYEMKSRPGRAVSDIDHMVRKARHACKKAMGKVTEDAE